MFAKGLSAAAHPMLLRQELHVQSRTLASEPPSCDFRKDEPGRCVLPGSVKFSQPLPRPTVLRKDAVEANAIGWGAATDPQGWPSQVTRLFQSTNAPCGFSRQAQTWSSKKGAGMLYRFGLSISRKDCPSRTGGPSWLLSHVAESTMNSTPTRLILPFEGS
jgi:hypothetical protein